jgi:hypothetical protein
MLTVSNIPHPFKMARNQGHGIEDFSRKMAATALMNMETGCDIAETEGYYENSGGDDGTVPISAIAKPDIGSLQAEVHGDVAANDEKTSTNSSSEKSGDTTFVVEATSLNNKAVEEAANHTLDIKDFSNNEAVEEAKIEDDVVDYGTAEVNDTLDIKDFSNNEEVEEEKVPSTGTGKYDFIGDIEDNPAQPSKGTGVNPKKKDETVDEEPSTGMDDDDGVPSEIMVPIPIYSVLTDLDICQHFHAEDGGLFVVLKQSNGKESVHPFGYFSVIDGDALALYANINQLGSDPAFAKLITEITDWELNQRGFFVLPTSADGAREHKGGQGGGGKRKKGNSKKGSSGKREKRGSKKSSSGKKSSSRSAAKSNDSDDDSASHSGSNSSTSSEPTTYSSSTSSTSTSLESSSSESSSDKKPAAKPKPAAAKPVKQEVVINRYDDRLSAGSVLNSPSTISQCVDKFVREKVHAVGKKLSEVHQSTQSQDDWDVRVDGFYVIRNEITNNPNGKQPTDFARKRVKPQLNILCPTKGGKEMALKFINYHEVAKTHEIHFETNALKFSNLLSAPPGESDPSATGRSLDFPLPTASRGRRIVRYNDDSDAKKHKKKEKKRKMDKKESKSSKRRKR